jgi:hypothetical protein
MPEGALQRCGSDVFGHSRTFLTQMTALNACVAAAAAVIREAARVPKID